MNTAESLSSSPEELLDDRDLINRVACHGDRDAFQCLFLRFGPKIKALMIRGGADSATAEDLAQDAMLTLWRKSKLYSPERGTVAAWVFTIARNLRIDRLRRQSPQVFEDIDELHLEAPIASGEEETEMRQRNNLISQALAALPSDQRRVIEMSFVQDMAQTDIAQALDLPLGTVKSRIRLGYAKLRERLEFVK